MNTQASDRYQVRRIDTPDGRRYAVIDTRTGLPVGMYANQMSARWMADWKNRPK
jgi:hypothetical protein